MKLLEEFVENMLGDEAVKIFKILLRERKDLTEDEISEKTGLARNITRKNLYLLQEYRLVSYKRIKNRETGWYYYYWRINDEELPLILLELKKDIINKLKLKMEKLKLDTAAYMCTVCKRRYSFSEAFNNEFKCAHCDNELVYVETNSYVDKLSKIVTKLEEELLDEQRKIQGS